MIAAVPWQYRRGIAGNPPFWRFDKQGSGEIGHLLTLAAQGIIRLNLLVKTPPFRKQKKLFKFSMFDHQTCIYRIGRMKTHSL
ncbi:hypothetical protein CF138_01875 [Aeromonas hydrophila]|nr:hypothetical protein CF138_01875 [Aeromonas hydrophila]TNH94170.1 hypothetical protein CF136_21310 [Aeromonas hydrophila]TNI90898.1 hypothetical protein CF118_22275 [Aeromonas hydrophila]